jgi:hypothetical protein
VFHLWGRTQNLLVGLVRLERDGACDGASSIFSVGRVSILPRTPDSKVLHTPYWKGMRFCLIKDSDEVDP